MAHDFDGTKKECELTPHMFDFTEDWSLAQESIAQGPGVTGVSGDSVQDSGICVHLLLPAIGVVRETGRTQRFVSSSL